MKTFMKTLVKDSLSQILSFVCYPFYKKPVLDQNEFYINNQKLISKFSKLDFLETKTNFASANEWHRNLNELKENILSHGGERFLKFDIVRRTMFITYANYTRIELQMLKARKDWRRWKEALRETIVGLPTPYLFWPLSSSNLIHHAYHVSRLEDELKFKANNLQVVFEFGGGYGSMCRLFHELEFRGLYVIYDFPHFSEIQSYFLKSQGYKDLTLEEAKKGLDGFICVSSVDELAEILKGSFSSKKETAFIATWSFSESPLSVRQPLEEYIKMFKYNLIAYQKVFNEVDNQKYFRALFPRDFYKIFEEEIGFLKGNYYFLTERGN